MKKQFSYAVQADDKGDGHSKRWEIKQATEPNPRKQEWQNEKYKLQGQTERERH